MDLLKKIKMAGVVGAGGAGFPSHIKLDTKVSTFIINAAECEPLLETDKYIMRHNTAVLIDAIDLVASHLNAKRIVIGLKHKYHEEIDSLKNIIEMKKMDIEIFESKNFYPAGDEQILVNEITGTSVPEAGIPLDVDCVVSNVATLVDIYNAYQDDPVVKRLVTITGEVNEPILLEVPIGVTLEKCLEYAGGPSLDDYSVLLGGPMMGSECGKDELAKTYVTKTLSGINVLPKDHLIYLKKNLSLSHIIRRAASTCIQCRMCTDLCPRYLIGHNLRPHMVMRAMGNGEKNLDTLKEALLCCECGVCEMYACPMELSPKTMNQNVKEELYKHGIRYTKDVNKETVTHDMREYRRVNTTRLISRLNLEKYKHIHLDDKKRYQLDKEEVVSIGIKQHIGSASIPIVKVGDCVKKGDKIAEVSEGSLGANIHASVEGIVVDVNDFIRIKSTERSD